tara:strand:+ start:123 stop:395 length:273 start_codon:yes stop_codon:yes gene_type:complete
MTNDKHYADKYFASFSSKRVQGMLPVMRQVIRDSVARGWIGIFASMDGFEESDKNKMSAYRVLAASMGITVGQWKLNRETGVARATITQG